MNPIEAAATNHLSFCSAHQYKLLIGYVVCSEYTVGASRTLKIGGRSLWLWFSLDCEQRNPMVGALFIIEHVIIVLLVVMKRIP